MRSQGWGTGAAGPGGGDALMPAIHGLLSIFFLLMPVGYSVMSNVQIPFTSGGELASPRLNIICVVLACAGYWFGWLAIAETHCPGIG